MHFCYSCVNNNFMKAQKLANIRSPTVGDRPKILKLYRIRGRSFDASHKPHVQIG